MTAEIQHLVDNLRTSYSRLGWGIGTKLFCENFLQVSFPFDLKWSQSFIPMCQVWVCWKGGGQHKMLWKAEQFSIVFPSILAPRHFWVFQTAAPRQYSSHLHACMLTYCGPDLGAIDKRHTPSHQLEVLVLFLFLFLSVGGWVDKHECICLLRPGDSFWCCFLWALSLVFWGKGFLGLGAPIRLAGQ